VPKRRAVPRGVSSGVTMMVSVAFVPVPVDIADPPAAYFPHIVSASH
jgi:hypothetical protein